MVLRPRGAFEDMANVCIVHNVTEQNVALRFLASSFKGKSQDRYTSFTPNSIGSWDQLGDHFFERFIENGDRSSLMQQIIMIRRALQEAIIELDTRF